MIWLQIVLKSVYQAFCRGGFRTRPLARKLWGSAFSDFGFWIVSLGVRRLEIWQLLNYPRPCSGLVSTMSCFGAEPVRTSVRLTAQAKTNGKAPMTAEP